MSILLIKQDNKIPTTIEEWLNKLEEPHREKALTNLKERGANPPTTICSRMSEAIDRAFTWSRQPESQKKPSYWPDLQAKYVKNENSGKLDPKKPWLIKS